MKPLNDYVPTRIAGALAGVLSVGVLALAGSAQAAPGDLDSTFGAGGTVFSQMDIPNASTIEDVAVQADGRVVALERRFSGGPTRLLRYLPGGTPDPSFGGDGIVDVASGIIPGQLVLQPDGKIVLGGFDLAGGFAVARFLSSGDLDADFDGDSGSANGVVHAQLTAGLDVPTALTIDGKNRIVVAGHAAAAPDAGDVGVVRFLPTGSLDKSFHGIGNVVFDTPVEAAVWDVATQPDGKVVIAGGWGSFPNADTLIQRFTEGGLPDKFGPGNEGRQVLNLGGHDEGISILVQPSGKLLVGSDTGGEDRLVRLLANGELDAGFANGGNVPLGYQVESMAATADGKIVLGGFGPLDGVPAFALERRSSEGLPDPAFAGGAPVLTRVAPGERAFGDAVAVAPDGKIVLGGSTGDSPTIRGAIARYQGEPDAPSAAAPAVVTAPLTLTRLRVTRRAFAVGRTATARVGQAQAARRRKRGTAFVFRLNRTAKVTIRIRRVASTRSGRRRPRVVRLRRVAHAGGNRVRFSGRVGRRALRAGRYRARLVAVDAGGSRSKPRTVKFRIVRG